MSTRADRHRRSLIAAAMKAAFDAGFDAGVASGLANAHSFRSMPLDRGPQKENPDTHRRRKAGRGS